MKRINNEAKHSIETKGGHKKFTELELMIVYSGTKQQFQDDVMTNNIAGIVAAKLKEKTGHGTGLSEFASWQNSLQYMDRILGDVAIPVDS